MTDCRIFKKPTSDWIYSFNGPPKLVKKWVAICPKCNVHISSAGYGYYGNTKNTRKTAKDALHKHMRAFH